MASTYSNLKIQLMATGENATTWGDITNDNIGIAIEQAVVETATVTFASADITLTLSDSNSSQTARAVRLNLTGTTGGVRNLNVPAIQKPYIVINGTANTVTVKVSGQTGVAVPPGTSYFLYNTGTDVTNALNGISVTSGGTGRATLTANSLLLGNGADPVQLIAPGTAGNVLTSDGSTWASTTASSFVSGTVAIFNQTTAPTGWTKDTVNYNNSGLRLVTGSASTGGSVDFTTAFASKTPTGTVSITGVTASGGATTLTTPQIPSHTHSGVNPGAISTNNSGNPGSPLVMDNNPSGRQLTGLTGGDGSHDHPFSFSSGSASFSGNSINLAVKYIDVIRATKV